MQCFDPLELKAAVLLSAIRGAPTGLWKDVCPASPASSRNINKYLPLSASSLRLSTYQLKLCKDPMKYMWYPHYTDEETERQRSHLPGVMQPVAGKVRTPGGLVPEPSLTHPTGCQPVQTHSIPRHQLICFLQCAGISEPPERKVWMDQAAGSPVLVSQLETDGPGKGMGSAIAKVMQPPHEIQHLTH